MDPNDIYDWKAEDLREADELESKSNSSKEEVKETNGNTLSNSMPPNRFIPMIN